MREQQVGVSFQRRAVRMEHRMSEGMREGVTERRSEDGTCEEASREGGRQQERRRRQRVHTSVFPLRMNSSLWIGACLAGLLSLTASVTSAAPVTSAAASPPGQWDPSLQAEVQALIDFKAALFETASPVLDTWQSENPCDGTWEGVTCARPGVVTAIVLPKRLLTGTLSPSIGDLIGLERLDLSHNNIRGPLPESLGQLYRVQDVQLQANSLSGTIPDSLGNLVACTRLYLNNNQLRGFVPLSLTIIPDLRTFGNPLCSTLPATSCTLPLRAPASPRPHPPPRPRLPRPLTCAPCAPTQTQDYHSCACLTATTLEITFTSPRLPRCTAAVQLRITSFLKYGLEVGSNELTAMSCQERPGQAALMLAYISTDGSADPSPQELRQAIEQHAVKLPPPFSNYSLSYFSDGDSASAPSPSPAQTSESAHTQSSKAGASVGLVVGAAAAGAALLALVMAFLYCCCCQAEGGGHQDGGGFLYKISKVTGGLKHTQSTTRALLDQSSGSQTPSQISPQSSSQNQPQGLPSYEPTTLPLTQDPNAQDHNSQDPKFLTPNLQAPSFQSFQDTSESSDPSFAFQGVASERAGHHSRGGVLGSSLESTGAPARPLNGSEALGASLASGGGLTLGRGQGGSFEKPDGVPVYTSRGTAKEPVRGVYQETPSGVYLELAEIQNGRVPGAGDTAGAWGSAVYQGPLLGEPQAATSPSASGSPPSEGGDVAPRGGAAAASLAGSAASSGAHPAGSSQPGAADVSRSAGVESSNPYAAGPPGTEVPRQQPASSSQRTSIQKLPLKAIQLATRSRAKGALQAETAYGKVYKAALAPSNGLNETSQLTLLSGQPLEETEFEQRVLALWPLAQCPRLAPVRGFCGEREQRWVAYEHGAHGTLEDHLHGEARFERALTWQRRVQVARDVAEALCYLHHSLRPPVAHQDVSAANVCLGPEFRARLSNTGIQTLVAAPAPLSTATAMGSLGYQAPEARIRGEQTACGDVFGFGTLMLEILTGRRPLDPSRPKGQQSLLTWVLPHLQNKAAITSLVDPHLRLNSHLDPVSLHLYSMIALHCLQQEAEERPSMQAVYQHLVELMDHPGTQASTMTPMTSPPPINFAMHQGMRHGAPEASESGESSLLDSVGTNNTFGSTIGGRAGWGKHMSQSMEDDDEVSNI